MSGSEPVTDPTLQEERVRRPSTPSPATRRQAGADGRSGRRPVLLAFAATASEKRLIEDWLERERGEGEPAAEMVEASDPFLGVRLGQRADDPALLPVRVAWLPVDRQGAHVLRLKDLVTLSHPRRPRPRAQARILRTDPERARVVTGAPATVSDLRLRFEQATGGGDELAFGDFVRRQGVLALERAERNLVGQRYKAARLVPEEVLASAQLKERLHQLAASTGRSYPEVMAEARQYLEEMAASHSELAIDAWEEFIRYVVRPYDIDVEARQLDRLRRLGSRHALAYLPSHRTYLDPFILRTVLHRHGLPPNHVLGGVNVAFWPVGSIARRSGMVFIRRSYKDKPIYSVMLREYIGYLLRKRFNLEWYIEGGRTRTGKLRPPRFGILAYLVDAFRTGTTEDVYLVPTSIVYEHLHEVRDIAHEDQGGEKPKESFRWMIGYLRRQNAGRSKVHVRFGEPLSLAEALVAAAAPAESGASPNGSGAAKRDLSVEKVAFEVCHRINRATPVTPTALVTTALLGIGDRALTMHEIRHVLEPLTDYVHRRQVPMTDDILERENGLRAVLEALQRNDVVASVTEGPEETWSVKPNRHLEASFYRNSIIHYLLNRAIVELVAMRAAEDPFQDPQREAWEEALGLRDLLKFEFFFPARNEFGDELRGELDAFDPEWESRATEQEKVWDHLTSSRLFLAHRVLGPYIQAYHVVADRLAARDPEKVVDQRDLVRESLGAARQYRAQQRIWSSEAISKELFSNALQLAANRGMLQVGGEEVAALRKTFALELRGLLYRVRRIRDLAVRDLDLMLEGWPAR